MSNLKPRVLVTGGRMYSDGQAIGRELKALCPCVVIEGGSKGADELARIWAHKHHVVVETHLAQWSLYGRAAGPIRNQAMIDEGKPDVVLAFPGGVGTADMVRRAKAAGIRVVEVS